LTTEDVSWDGFSVENHNLGNGDRKANLLFANDTTIYVTWLMSGLQVADGSVVS